MLNLALTHKAVLRMYMTSCLKVMGPEMPKRRGLLGVIA